MKKTKKANEMKEALKALDQQIYLTNNEAARILLDKGAQSPEYSEAMDNIKVLCEARAAMANSMPKKQQSNVAPVAIGAAATVLQTVILLVYDEEHVVPKWFKGGIEVIKTCLRAKD